VSGSDPPHRYEGVYMNHVVANPMASKYLACLNYMAFKYLVCLEPVACPIKFVLVDLPSKSERTGL